MAQRAAGIEKGQGLMGRVLSVRWREGRRGAVLNAGIPREGETVSLDALIGRFPGASVSATPARSARGVSFLGGGTRFAADQSSRQTTLSSAGPSLRTTTIVMVATSVVITIIVVAGAILL